MATTSRGIGPVVGALLAALLLSAPAVSTATAAPSPDPSGADQVAARATARLSIAQMERKVRALTNERRVAHGCQRLKPHDALTRAAGRHSARMADARVLDHQLPGEPGLRSRIVSAGYTNPTRWGENVAAGQPTPRAVVRAWMDSPSHRANILDCRYRHLGVGLAYGGGYPWWTQDFGRR